VPGGLAASTGAATRAVVAATPVATTKVVVRSMSFRFIWTPGVGGVMVENVFHLALASPTRQGLHGPV
jgi:hypothetical protein